MGRGEISAQVLPRLEQGTFNIDADIVLVRVGINDLNSIVFYPNDSKSIVEKTKNNLKRVVKKIEGKSNQLIVITITPPSMPQGLWHIFGMIHFTMQCKKLIYSLSTN